MKKKVLVIGSGGREHALLWKLSQSPRISKLYAAPGNAGTAGLAENVPIAATDIGGLINFVLSQDVDITVVGPDDPLAMGIVDAFSKKNLKIFGPSRQAAQIEASKVFSKNLMKAAGIPTAKFGVFSDYQSALAYLEQVGAPIVVKASGLALGKGVFVCQSLEEAKAALKQIMVDKAFGQAGAEVVIEEFLDGPEISIHAFCDGHTFQLLPSAQDHKPVFDEGKGPNTGGMGTIAPVPWVSENLLEEIKSSIVKPTLNALEKQSSPFCGILYPGLKITKEGPKVLEFNARFGDPETQSYMRLLKTGLLDIIEACIEGKLDSLKIEWNEGFACCIVLASGGYPGHYEKGKSISGLDSANKAQDVVVFHAGTSIKGSELVTNGGRVLGVTAIGENLKSALDKAYKAIDFINFEGMHFRKDIGAKSL